jgi:RimJ/RimL family protein N-acetyltransferase
LIVAEPREVIAAWVGAQVGLEFKPPYSVLASIGAHDHIICGVVFHTWTGRDIELSVAASSIPRSLLKAIYSYTVDQLGCRRVTFRIRSSDLKTQESAQRLGAKWEGRIRRFYSDTEDAVILGILKEDFPYGLSSRSRVRLDPECSNGSE